MFEGTEHVRNVAATMLEHLNNHEKREFLNQAGRKRTPIVYSECAGSISKFTFALRGSFMCEMNDIRLILLASILHCMHLQVQTASFASAAVIATRIPPIIRLFGLYHNTTQQSVPRRPHVEEWMVVTLLSK